MERIAMQSMATVKGCYDCGHVFALPRGGVPAYQSDPCPCCGELETSTVLERLPTLLDAVVKAKELRLSGGLSAPSFEVAA